MRGPFGLRGCPRSVSRDERSRTPSLASRYVVHRATGGHGGALVQDRVLPALARERVAMLDQQPIGALFVLPIAHPGEDPATPELLAFQSKIQLALVVRLLRVVAIPESAIPHHHRAAAVLALRNGAFEVAVVQRMVLDLYREPLVAGV